MGLSIMNILQIFDPVKWQCTVYSMLLYIWLLEIWRTHYTQNLFVNPWTWEMFTQTGRNIQNCGWNVIKLLSFWMIINHAQPPNSGREIEMRFWYTSQCMCNGFPLWNSWRHLWHMTYFPSADDWLLAPELLKCHCHNNDLKSQTIYLFQAISKTNGFVLVKI